MSFGYDSNVVRTSYRRTGRRTDADPNVDGPRSVHFPRRIRLQCRAKFYRWKKDYVKLRYSLYKVYIQYVVCFSSGIDNELEAAREMPDLPKLMSLEAFRNAILERFNDRLGIDQVSGLNKISLKYKVHPIILF